MREVIEGKRERELNGGDSRSRSVGFITCDRFSTTGRHRFRVVSVDNNNNNNMSVDAWCKASDDKMQDVISEDDAVRFCRVTTEEDGGGGGGSSSSGIRGIAMDKDEKRMRREIANSNERRRMQSINAGFQSLRQMLPHHEGEKLSKVCFN